MLVFRKILRDLLGMKFNTIAQFQKIGVMHCQQGSCLDKPLWEEKE